LARRRAESFSRNTCTAHPLLRLEQLLQKVHLFEGPLHRHEEDGPVAGDLLPGFRRVGYGDHRVHIGSEGALDPVLDHVP
jgi:hypothetical protein